MLQRGGLCARCRMNGCTLNSGCTRLILLFSMPTLVSRTPWCYGFLWSGCVGHDLRVMRWLVKKILRLDFACTVVAGKVRPAHTMITAKTYEVLRKAWTRLSGFRCEMRWQRELFGDQHRGHTVRAMLHAVDVVVT